MRTRRSAARLITDFDSSVNMVRALGRFLRGEGHPALSVGPASAVLGDLLSAPPQRMRRRIFEAMGAMQGIPPERAGDIRADDLARWVLAQYPPGPFPAAVVGAPSGAAVHLAAALGAPFLPQTLLVSLRDRTTHPDRPVEAMHALAPIARQVARHNPELAVYHMHDPAQDRPMLQNMAYLRLKRLRLGSAFGEFLRTRLTPGGTILVLDCTSRWASTRTGERAYFQFGCLGGIDEDEYRRGSPRIAAYLAAEGSAVRGWDPPEPDGRRPEAEWGFDPALLPDLEQAAADGGHRLRRLVVAEPQHLSPAVADLHRDRYRRRGMSGQRLLVESYVQWDPLWTLRLGAVPFWMRFNMEPDHADLARYLAGTEPYDDIHINLFSQGICSPGVVGIPEWERLAAARARRTGEVIGVHRRTYPIDPGSTLRYQPAFRSLPGRHPLPPALPAGAAEEFFARHHSRSLSLE